MVRSILSKDTMLLSPCCLPAVLQEPSSLVPGSIQRRFGNVRGSSAIALILLGCRTLRVLPKPIQEKYEIFEVKEGIPEDKNYLPAVLQEPSSLVPGSIQRRFGNVRGSSAIALILLGCRTLRALPKSIQEKYEIFEVKEGIPEDKNYLPAVLQEPSSLVPGSILRRFGNVRGSSAIALILLGCRTLRALPKSIQEKYEIFEVKEGIPEDKNYLPAVLQEPSSLVPGSILRRFGNVRGSSAIALILLGCRTLRVLPKQSRRNMRFSK